MYSEESSKMNGPALSMDFGGKVRASAAAISLPRGLTSSLG